MYEIDDSLKTLADKVIKAHEELAHLDDEELRIVFMRTDKAKSSKGRTVYADTEKLNDKHAALTGAQFVITFYADSEQLDERRLEILMYHELRHVGWDCGSCFMIPHDCEDFRDIINEYGADWIGG